MGGVLRYKLEVYRQHFSDKLYGLGVPEQCPLHLGEASPPPPNIRGSQDRLQEKGIWTHGSRSFALPNFRGFRPTGSFLCLHGRRKTRQENKTTKKNPLGEEKEPKPKLFWTGIFSGGVGVFHKKGWGVHWVRYVLRIETQGNRKKRLCSILVPISEKEKMGKFHPTPMLPTPLRTSQARVGSGGRG